MSALLLSRTALRRTALGTGIGLAIGLPTIYRQPPRLRMDALSSPRPTSRAGDSPVPASKDELLKPDVIRQLSGGSVTGFLTGLLVSVFSKTLVLLLGVSVVLVQVAARCGIDLMQQLKVRQRLGNSRVLAALEKDPTFKVSFGLFFAMSAFMSF